jgi:hypothetical protein
MPPQNANSQSSAPLPLFRPEPIAARLRIEGEVLLVRPLSLSLLTGLALATAAVAIACLLFIRVPETRSLPVLISTAGTGNGSITFSVPPDLGTKLVLGERLPVTLRDGGGAQRKLFATIEHVSAFSNQEQTEIAANISPVDLALSPTAYVEIPTGTCSLADWLLHREGE